MSFTKRMNEEIVDAVLTTEDGKSMIWSYEHARPDNDKFRNLILNVCTEKAMDMSEGMCDPTVMRNMFKAELD